MMKKYLITFLFTLLLVSPVFAETPASFISDQIWYVGTLEEGNTVKIYTAVWNGNANPLSGKVEFYDKNVVLGSREVSVSKEQLQSVYISWKVTSGDHLITAKLISPSILVNGVKESVILSNNETKSSKQFVPVKIKKEEVVSDSSVQEKSDIENKIREILPESVNKKVSNGLGVVEDFREETLVKISNEQEKTEEKIAQIKSSSKDGKSADLESATEGPIAQVKLFFLNVLHFVFNNKIVFYGLVVFIVFLTLRKIYRIIRRK